MTFTARLIPVARQLARPQTPIWRAGARRSFATRSPCEFAPVDYSCTDKIQYGQESTQKIMNGSNSMRVEKLVSNNAFKATTQPDSIGTIGITEYASKALGSVVYVELPEVDLEMSKGDTIGAVESVKSASDIMSPVSGKVVEVNDVLADKPGKINEGPESDGWFAKIELSDVAELDELMTKEQYDSFETESSS